MSSPPRELTQEFTFANASAAELADVFATAPLVGEDGIFGTRTVRSTSTGDGLRTVEGFEPLPVPLLRFDFEIRPRPSDRGTLLVVDFTQPERGRPYLDGQFVWRIEDGVDGSAVLREQINTPAALAIVERPLNGSPLSLRRWLFFAGGHERLMREVAGNIERLLR